MFINRILYDKNDKIMNMIKRRIKRMIFSFKYKHDPITCFLYRIVGKIFFRSFFKKKCEKEYERVFKKRWLKDNLYFDFNGAKLPDISNNGEKMHILKMVFEDVFMISCFCKDNYNKKIVRFVDQYMGEGPYGYTDGIFDVSVKENDVVIDVGAWIGDFSAYAASKGAIAYAFEPVKETFQTLCLTSKLNDSKIYPVQKGLGNKDCELFISINENNSGANSILIDKREDDHACEKIIITTLDKFVEEHNLRSVDFIKADIEGAEREMLQGASNVLKVFAPKLAICTYHLPDDPIVLEKIILEANPAYKVIHTRHKLFAMVITDIS
jgi:FkbM family methyltransferase